MEMFKQTPRLYPIMPQGSAEDCKVSDPGDLNSAKNKLDNTCTAKHPTTLSVSHSAPVLTLTSTNGETKEDLGIYGPVGTREASVNWFKATQATQLLPDKHSLTSNSLYEEWFHGIITRRESERMLESCDVGYFLIRLGESRLGYTLSFRDKERCRHYMIDYSEPNQQYHVLGEPAKHSSLAELVDYYKQNQLQNWSGLLTEPCRQDEGQCDYLELVITPQDEKSLDAIWRRPRLEASAPLCESGTVQAGGQYGIALTQHTTAHPASVTRALNQLLLKNRRQGSEEDARYTSEPARGAPEPAQRTLGPLSDGSGGSVNGLGSMNGFEAVNALGPLNSSGPPVPCSRPAHNAGPVKDSKPVLGPRHSFPQLPDANYAYCEVDGEDTGTLNEDGESDNVRTTIKRNNGKNSSIGSASSISSNSSGISNISNNSNITNNSNTNSNKRLTSSCDNTTVLLNDNRRRPLPSIPWNEAKSIQPPPLPVRSHH